MDLVRRVREHLLGIKQRRESRKNGRNPQSMSAPRLANADMPVNESSPLYAGAALRVSNTGTGEVRRTSSASLPRTMRRSPRRPCVPMTIMSAGHSAA